MKRLLLILISLLMSFSVCACNDDSERESKNDYEQAIEQLIDVCYFDKVSKKTLLATAPQNFWQRWADEGGYENLDEFFTSMEYGYSSVAELFGAHYKKVDYEIKYPTKLSTDECALVEKALEKRDELNYEEITQGYSLDITFKITGMDDEYEEETRSCVAVKMGGKWYIADYTDTRVRWTVDGFI